MTDLRDYILMQAARLHDEAEQVRRARYLVWTDALTLSPFEPGDHLIWAQKVLWPDAPHGCALTFVQVISTDAPRLEGQRPITYRST